MENKQRKPTLYEALFILILAAGAILYAVKVLDTAVHIPLVFSAVVAAIMSLTLLKAKWALIEEAVISRGHSSYGHRRRFGSPGPGQRRVCYLGRIFRR